VTLDDHKLDHITEKEFKKKLENLRTEYEDIFCKSPKYMGKTQLIEHKIEFTEDKPVKCRPYRVSKTEREIFDTQIQEMLECGVIRPCHSLWASRVILVKKKDGSTRFCVDSQ